MPKPLLPCILLAALTLAATGCATSRLIPASSEPVAIKLSGAVHGGQQPVSGAAIQLYAAGQTGNQSAATALLTSPVLTDANGGFSLTGLYTCPSAATQIYLAATGGNPGLSAGHVNSHIALMAALGNCGDQSASTVIAVNEVSTVAAAFALAPFAASIDHIGASAGNAAGLANAMQIARLLADPATGQSPAQALPANATVESAKLYTLANLLATCVNSSGGRPCNNLKADSGAAAADTFSAALAIASAPSVNVAQLFNDITPQAPFGGGLTVAPSDFTVSISYTGGGLSAPTALAVDATGNIWVANVSGALSAFSPTGSPLWQNGITGSGLDHSASVAIGPTSNLWVGNMVSGAVNSNDGSVTSLSTSGNILSGATGYASPSINLPGAIQASPSGSVWVANFGTGMVALLASDGSVLSGAGYGGGVLTSPSAIAIDPNLNAWIADRSTGTLVHLDASGNVMRVITPGGLPDALAFDTAGTLWVGDNANSILTNMSAGGTALATITGGGLSRPRTLAIDAGNHVFLTNNVGNTISAFDASNGGAALAPNGYGVDAKLQQPTGLAVDASGTLWVASFSDNRLVAFPGLGTPTQTPRQPLPTQP